MNHNTIKRIFKWSLLIVPVGSFAYINRHFYLGSMYQVHKFDQKELSTSATDYVNKNNLVSPFTFENYKHHYQQDHFFERSILNQLNGLNEYNVFMDKTYYQALTNQIQVTPEERKKLHENGRIHCIFKANSRVQGHLGIIHGGFTSTLFDNLAGSLAYFASDLNPAVTSYLNISYKKPLKIGKEYIALVEVDKIEGEKIYIKGRITDDSNTIYTTIDSLFSKTNLAGFNSNDLHKAIQVAKEHPTT